MSLNDRDWTPLMLEHFDRDTMCLVHNDVRRRLGDALAENQRLRDALERIAEVKCHDAPSAIHAWGERGQIAREALKGGDDS